MPPPPPVKLLCPKYLCHKTTNPRAATYLCDVILRGSEAWISNTIDWEYSSELSLMSISSYGVHSTKETGNIYECTLRTAI